MGTESVPNHGTRDASTSVRSSSCVLVYLAIGGDAYKAGRNVTRKTGVGKVGRLSNSPFIRGTPKAEYSTVTDVAFGVLYSAV